MARQARKTSQPPQKPQEAPLTDQTNPPVDTSPEVDTIPETKPDDRFDGLKIEHF